MCACEIPEWLKSTGLQGSQIWTLERENKRARAETVQLDPDGQKDYYT